MRLHTLPIHGKSIICTYTYMRMHTVALCSQATHTYTHTPHVRTHTHTHTHTAHTHTRHTRTHTHYTNAQIHTTLIENAPFSKLLTFLLVRVILILCIACSSWGKPFSFNPAYRKMVEPLTAPLKTYSTQQNGPASQKVCTLS